MCHSITVTQWFLYIAQLFLTTFTFIYYGYIVVSLPLGITLIHPVNLSILWLNSRLTIIIYWNSHRLSWVIVLSHTGMYSLVHGLEQQLPLCSIVISSSPFILAVHFACSKTQRLICVRPLLSQTGLCLYGHGVWSQHWPKTWKFNSNNCNLNNFCL